MQVTLGEGWGNNFPKNVRYFGLFADSKHCYNVGDQNTLQSMDSASSKYRIGHLGLALKKLSRTSGPEPTAGTTRTDAPFFKTKKKETDLHQRGQGTKSLDGEPCNRLDFKLFHP